MKFSKDFVFGGATAAYQCKVVLENMEKEK